MKRPFSMQKLFERPGVKEILEDFSKGNHEPSPWLQALKIAYQCERQFDWEGAEKAYMVACEVEENPGLRAMGYMKLSAFYSIMGRREEALETASKAVKVADEFSLKNALHCYASLCLEADKVEEAEQLTIRLLEIATDTEVDLMHYYGLLLRAHVAIKKGQLAEAQAHLDDVWDNIEAGDRAFMMAGFQKGIGDWWSLTAQIHAASGDTAAAIAARREDVKRRRIIAQLPQLEGLGKHNNLARSLWKLGKELEAANDAGARHAFNECRSIRESIGLSGDFS